MVPLNFATGALLPVSHVWMLPLTLPARWVWPCESQLHNAWQSPNLQHSWCVSTYGWLWIALSGVESFFFFFFFSLLAYFGMFIWQLFFQFDIQKHTAYSFVLFSPSLVSESLPVRPTASCRETTASQLSKWTVCSCVLFVFVFKRKPRWRSHTHQEICRISLLSIDLMLESLKACCLQMNFLAGDIKNFPPCDYLSCHVIICPPFIKPFFFLFFSPTFLLSHSFCSSLPSCPSAPATPQQR